MNPPYVRPQAAVLRARLKEPRRFIQILAGPRQVGKTTLVRQILAEWSGALVMASADEPALKGREWIHAQWESARIHAGGTQRAGSVLALDEIQKIPGWSESVKRLWDEDTASGTNVKTVLLGSSPLVVHQGLTESLAGRFEIISLPHWSYAEMQAAFGWDFEEFLLFGGYPGGAPLVGDPGRWVAYIKDALIETTLSRDVLLLNRVDKPALLRRLFDLACRYSGQILSYNKMLGQLTDAGNTTTLAHYLELLAGAGMVTGLQKYSGSHVRRRASSPKLQVMNTALMTAQSGRDPARILEDHDQRGRLVESSVGAHLANAAAAGRCELFYWREGDLEVDFVVSSREKVTAIEVKSGATTHRIPGVAAFVDRFGDSRHLLVGQGGIPVEEFLIHPADHWIG